MDSKLVIRERGRAARAGLDGAARAALDRRIVARCQEELDWAQYRRVMVFLPIERQREIDTWPLVRWIWATWPGVAVYAPRVEAGAMQAVRLGPDTVLAESDWGITEPESGPLLGAHEALDLMLVPLLGFDATGHRVGYGGGYYDRFLALYRNNLRIGLGYEAMLAPRGIAAAAHDIRLQGVITERQRYSFV
ncbi:MAG TPA: 5-formyltetrahydrofolate cyclo-ligase [Candidatus Saccharimonadia bacterium]|nr:5-formyltetrahydrofolate cyclo-ligase [Candidatus Saccharimonadia bacterium]